MCVLAYQRFKEGENAMSYPAPSQFFRTPAQKKDMFLSWNRSDMEFFGGGACHILAYLFYDLHRGEGYDIIYTRPLGNHPGNHVYCCKDDWVFDTAGWTREILPPSSSVFPVFALGASLCVHSAISYYISRIDSQPESNSRPGSVTIVRKTSA